MRLVGAGDGSVGITGRHGSIPSATGSPGLFFISVETSTAPDDITTPDFCCVNKADRVVGLASLLVRMQ